MERVARRLFDEVGGRLGRSCVVMRVCGVFGGVWSYSKVFGLWLVEEDCCVCVTDAVYADKTRCAGRIGALSCYEEHGRFVLPSVRYL